MTDPRGGPISGASNWTAGYMPAAYQGTLFRSKGAPLLDLATPAGVSDRDAARLARPAQEAQRGASANRVPTNRELAARI